MPKIKNQTRPMSKKREKELNKMTMYEIEDEIKAMKEITTKKIREIMIGEMTEHIDEILRSSQDVHTTGRFIELYGGIAKRCLYELGDGFGKTMKDKYEISKSFCDLIKREMEEDRKSELKKNKKKAA